jgi:hypothetical protein
VAVAVALKRPSHCVLQRLLDQRPTNQGEPLSAWRSCRCAVKETALWPAGVGTSLPHLPLSRVSSTSAGAVRRPPPHRGEPPVGSLGMADPPAGASYHAHALCEQARSGDFDNALEELAAADWAHIEDRPLLTKVRMSWPLPSTAASGSAWSAPVSSLGCPRALRWRGRPSGRQRRIRRFCTRVARRGDGVQACSRPAGIQGSLHRRARSQSPRP